MLKRLLAISVILVLLVGCGGDINPISRESSIPEANATFIPVEKVAENKQLDKVYVEKTEEEVQKSIFWNKPMHSGIPECQSDFEFTHKVVAPEDVEQIMFGSGAHVAPHDHMAYWGLPKIDNGIVTGGGKKQIAERVQLYTPTDIFYINIWKENRTTGGRITNPDESVGLTYEEWGGYFYGCNGHQLMMGHLIEPSNEMNILLSANQPTCDKHSCRWEFPTFIPSGTPIFRSSGYVGAFDFGLSLAGLTMKELQQQPGYGYSITPWRTASGKSVCPIEYFPEPLRSEYINLLGNYKCGPFNQDVPGTAMGFWLPSPSPEIFPGFSSDTQTKDVDEWETVWLFQSYRDSSIHSITVGNNTFGLNQGRYSFAPSEIGLINQRWDYIKPGQTYCTELKIQINNSEISPEVHKITLIEISEDGTQLNIEAINNDKCGNGPWIFQGGQRKFYR